VHVVKFVEMDDEKIYVRDDVLKEASVARYYAGQKILAVIVCHLKKKNIVIRTLLSS
jgi:hypothetical protein